MPIDRTKNLKQGEKFRITFANPSNDKRFATVSKVPVFNQSRTGDPSKAGSIPAWLKVAETFTTEYRTQKGMPTYTEYKKAGSDNKLITGIPKYVADNQKNGWQRFGWVDKQGIIKDDEQPWCAPGMGMICTKAGISIPPSYTSAKGGWGDKWGTELKLNQRTLGAMLLYSSTYGEGRGHICFYVGEDDKNIYTLGCNQDDTIDIQARPKNDPEKRLLKVIWPEGQKLPASFKQTQFKDYAASFVDRLTGIPVDKKPATNKPTQVKSKTKAA